MQSLVFVVLVAMSLVGCGASATTAERSGSLRSMVDGALAEPVGGLVAVVTYPDGETISASQGYAEDGVALEVDDAFRVASITKTYMAALILSLEEDGFLTLDTTVSTYLPDLGIDERITVRHLLDHSSGIGDHWGASHLASEECSGCSFTPEQVVAFVDVANPAFDPGSQWAYSNTGYVILGMVVEAVTGEELAVELRRRVLEPVGVEGSDLIGLEPMRTEPVAGHWRLEGEEPVAYPWPYEPVMSRAHAAGSLVSTAPDLIAFLDALFSGRIVSDDGLAVMLEADPKPSHAGHGPIRYGLGIHHPHEGEWWMHGGGIPGFQSVYIRDPVTSATVVVLSNCSGCLAPDDTAFDVIGFGTRLMEHALAEGARTP